MAASIGFTHLARFVRFALMGCPLLFDSPALAECPESSVTSCDPIISTTQPQFSISCYNSHPGAGHGTMHFNLVNGLFYVSGSGGSHGGYARFNAHDRYTVTGPPPGSAVTVVARLQLRGTLPTGCAYELQFIPRGNIVAKLMTGVDFQETSASTTITCAEQCCSTVPAMPSNVQLSIPCAVGQPFELGIHLYAYGQNGTSTIEALLSFDGLPRDATIASCQGYSQSAPVFANVTSWGRLKQIYR